MPGDITIGGAPQPDTGGDIVISSADPGASMIDITLPAVTAGARFLIVVVRDGAVVCSDPTWDKILDGVGGGGVLMDVYERTFDGTAGSLAGDVISFVSLSEQELQGSLVTLRYGSAVDLIYHVAHEPFTSTTAPETPSVDADSADDLALMVLSCNLDDVAVTTPAGWASIDTYGSGSVAPRTIAVATRRARATGTLSLESFDLSAPATGRVFTLAIRYAPPADQHSHWGPHYPDVARPTVTKPGIAASVALGPPYLNGGAGDQLVAQHEVVGTFGNGSRIAFVEGTLALAGEVAIAGSDVTVYFNDGDPIGAIVATVNASASPIKLTGTFNATDPLLAGDDEFALLDLEHGVDPRVGLHSRFFGPHFAASSGGSSDPTIPPSTPAGSATFALRLEAGLRVRYEWQTDVVKAYDGSERRSSWLDDPRETYAGDALITGADVLAVRGAIATHAANGAIFSVGLPYEATTLTGAVSELGGYTLSLATPTGELDWAVLGQRVLIVSGAGDDIEIATAVVQETDTAALFVDTPSDTAPLVPGALIMPLVPTLLDPEQSFARYRSGCERWALSARAAVFGYPISAAPGELTISLGLADVTFRAATPAVAVGLQLEVTSVLVVTITSVAGTGGDFDLYVEVPVGTTLGELNTALLADGSILLVGDWDPDAVILGFEGFALTPFVGATPAGYATMGRSGVVTTINGKPLWDRQLENASTITDSVHAMTEIVDLGGAVEGAIEATRPDWGRRLEYTSRDWQWCKAFLATVRGQWRTFYLPTGRADLVQAVGVDVLANVLTIDASVGSYELWASRGYNVLEVVQAGVSRYVTITADVTDGTNFVLTCEGAADLLDEVPVTRISWCELVHLESDAVEVIWQGDKTFHVALTARVVQQ